MKAVVVYRSLTGFTEKYARWIAEELNSPCINLKNITKESIPEGATVIFGGSLYAVGILGYREFKKLTKDSNISDIILFAVGASTYSEDILAEIKRVNLVDESDKDRALFYLRGGFNFSKLNVLNKLIMLLLKFKLKGKRDRSSEEQEMLDAYKTPLDATDRDSIKDLISYVRSLEGK